MTTDNELPWHAVRRDRAYLPETLTGSREEVVQALETLLVDRGAKGATVDALTDQIDVFIGKRKVGVYMP